MSITPRAGQKKFYASARQHFAVVHPLSAILVSPLFSSVFRELLVNIRTEPLIPGGKDRVWVGRMFRGSSTSALNYERNPLSQDAIAYTYEREAY